MSLSIQTNVAALGAADNINQTENKLSNTISQLSSGYRINSAADDAAGLGISESLEADIASYNQAGQNATDGLSVVQTASSSLGEVVNILTRMRSLAMEAANSDVNGSSSADGDVVTEFTQLSNELTRINSDATYNGVALFGTSFTFQVGIGHTATADTITADMTSIKVDATTLGVTVGTGGVQLDTNTNSESALSTIDTAIQSVSTDQATLGAVEERMMSAQNTIAAGTQSLSAADSGLRDVNVATASAQLAQEQVLAQAGISVLAQANQLPSLALKLLG